MTNKQRVMKEAESFVQKVLADSFNQRVDADTLRIIAEKVSRAVPEPQQKRA